MQLNRTYADLWQKHKAKIADWMFESICEHYREHGEMIRQYGICLAAEEDREEDQTLSNVPVSE